MTLRRTAPLLALALLIALPASAQGARVVSATGEKKVNGETAYVDVWVVVPPGKSDKQATDDALAEQGATPRRKKPPWAGGGGGGGGGGEQYFYTGLKWSSQVSQNYNPASQPSTAAPTALTNTHATWNGVSGSTYSIGFGGITSRCPSLVQECPGAQVTDGNEDVGWLALGGTTLGVTWYTTGSAEADMALNTRFTWKATCGAGSGYDIETVFLHENGHVAGLDHPNRTDSVMYASYQAPRCTLYDYDRRSLDNLY